MLKSILYSNLIDIRSLEEPEIIEAHKRQNTDCTYELSDFFDFSPRWVPMTLDQLKEKVTEDRKRPRTALLSLRSKGNEFVGIALWSSVWDTWCPRVEIIIWPEYRRKGYGSEIAGILMDATFNQNPGHVITAGVAEWNDAAIAFVKSLGFKDVGRMRCVDVKDGEYFDVVCFDILKKEYADVRTGANR